MYTASLPLVSTLEELRNERSDLSVFINEICDRIEATEPHIEALLPETDRRGRLLREAATLRERFPDPVERPALYGVLVGVKDLLLSTGLLLMLVRSYHLRSLLGRRLSCVRKLREAGALVLGLTVTSESPFLSPDRRATRVILRILLVDQAVALLLR